MADSHEFQVVNRQKKKKGHSHFASTTSAFAFAELRLEKNVSFNTIAFEKRLKECMQELKISEFYQHSSDLLLNVLLSMVNSSSGNHETKSDIESNAPKVPFHDLLSFGIGSFSTCPIARYQLAFLLVLREKLKNPPCLVYDPIFSVEENKMLQDLGCSLRSQNEEGKCVCLAPTIIFMPHCGKALYNNVLWANMTTLDNLIIIGNSFSRMLESTPHRHLSKTANYVIKVAPFMTETPLKSSSFIHSDVFNDLAIHTFPRSKLDTAPAEFWKSNAEPKYTEEDVEIILN